jgi:2-polyprenyl-6-methoxyphenol hydroxylase-like FAD-dependent oxidoreductase
VKRGPLHRALANRARGLGVEFRTCSVVSAASPAGSLTANGQEFAADLVVGADGYRSVVRESVKLGKKVKFLKEGAIRALAPRRNQEREGLTTEQWSGNCRLGIAPCSKDELYLYLIGPAKERGVHTVPVDKKFWCDLFPQETDVLSRIGDEARFDQFVYATVKCWSSGRVAIIGDAVHAQPPNLGQGAGMAMANASALGVALDNNQDVPTALKQWEEMRRPVTEKIQRWSYRYGVIFHGLPLGDVVGEHVRAGLMSLVGHVRFAARSLTWLRHGGEQHRA